MKRKVLIIIIFSISSILFSDYYLIPTSNIEILTEEQLYDKTLQFLTYARNEIFARKGYIFEAKDLETYFSNMGWYSKQSKNVVLNEIEKSNVTLLKRIEEKKKKTFPKSPAGLLYKFDFNNMSLFYIGLVEESISKKYYRNGKLLLLDNNWISNCGSIPYEFLQENCIGEIENIRDDCFAINDSLRFKIKDINNDNIEEVTIQTHPEAGQDNGSVIVITYFDNNLTKFFHNKGSLKKMEFISENILRVDLFKKMYIYHAGTGFGISYICNFSKQTVTQIPFHYKKVISNDYDTYKCIKVIPVYLDAISASDKNDKSIINKTVVDTNYLIDEIYFSESQKQSAFSIKNNIDAIRIKITDQKIGWINSNTVNFNDSFFYVPAGG